jgi:hypothetical protein
MRDCAVIWKYQYRPGFIVAAVYHHAAALLGVIRRMVSNMFQLQHTLQWQAWKAHSIDAAINRGVV